MDLMIELNKANEKFLQLKQTIDSIKQNPKNEEILKQALFYEEKINNTNDLWNTCYIQKRKTLAR